MLPLEPCADPGMEWATQSSVRDENTLVWGGGNHEVKHLVTALLVRSGASTIFLDS